MSKIIEPGSLLPRYLAGEHESVWADMMGLGPRVRQAPYFDDAWAVARETMRRARHNVELIVCRLNQIGYQFWNGKHGKPGPQPLRMMLGGQLAEYPSVEAAVEHALKRDLSQIPAGMGRHAEHARDQLVKLSGMMKGLEKQQAERAGLQAEEARKKTESSDHLTDSSVLSPLSDEEIADIQKFEKKGMVIPLSLRAWIEEVGDVNLAGAHPALSFWEDENFPRVYADPLMVCLDHFMFEIEGWLEACEEGDIDAMAPVLSWDAAAKARLAIEDEQLDNGYCMELPNAAADAALNGERHKTTFVNYLRIAFRWGGFPGWEQHEKRPERELKILTEELLPI